MQTLFIVLTAVILISSILLLNAYWVSNLSFFGVITKLIDKYIINK